MKNSSVFSFKLDRRYAELYFNSKLTFIYGAKGKCVHFVTIIDQNTLKHINRDQNKWNCNLVRYNTLCYNCLYGNYLQMCAWRIPASPP